MQITTTWLAGSNLLVLMICLSMPPELVNGQRGLPFGLSRSQSDPRLNRPPQGGYRSNHTKNSAKDSCKTNYEFDYTQLTLMWAPGACSTSPHECKREENRHFTVHGMWPTLKGTQEPAFCCFDNTFNFASLSPIMKDLNEFWFSYYDLDGSRGFWAHEWLKHGTCARDIQALKGELNYFNGTVQMAKSMPILETLKKSNIVPNNDKPYQSSDIQKALTTMSEGKSIGFECDYEHHQPIPILTGVNFCFDHQLKPADCPPLKRKCQRQLIFPQTSTRLRLRI